MRSRRRASVASPACDGTCKGAAVDSLRWVLFILGRSQQPARPPHVPAPRLRRQSQALSPSQAAIPARPPPRSPGAAPGAVPPAVPLAAPRPPAPRSPVRAIRSMAAAWPAGAERPAFPAGAAARASRPLASRYSAADGDRGRPWRLRCARAPLFQCGSAAGCRPTQRTPPGCRSLVLSSRVAAECYSSFDDIMHYDGSGKA